MEVLFSMTRAPTARIRVVILLAVFAGLWVLATLQMPLIPDEAYYWTWSEALAPRYFDHPPGIAWVLAISSKIFGQSVFSLRLISLVCIALTLLFSVLSVRRLLSKSRPEVRAEADELTVLLLLGAPMFVIGFLPITPDPIHGALTALAAYSSIRALEESSHGVWSGFAAMVFVLAIGIKHYAVFIAIGAFLGLLVMPSGRRRVRTLWPYLGIGVGLLILSPWLWAENQLVESSALWQFRRAIYGRANLGARSLPLMFGSLMGTLGPVTAILLLFGIAKTRTIFVLSFGSLSLLLACLFAVWAGSGEANWPMPALVFAVPILTLQLQKSSRWMRVFRWSGWAMVAVNGLFLLHAIAPFLPVERIHDPTQRGLGFDKVAAVALAMGREHSASVLVTDRYQIASMMRYHLRDALLVHEMVSPRARKSQFDLWQRPPVCGDRPVILLSPEASLPAWLQPINLSSESTRRLVERGVKGRKVLNQWYVTAALRRPEIGKGGPPCSRGVSGDSN
jgi:4-amino-4-deoxy-L-arabinose transferase-like glycosyltransferase